jgi:hypothetical protein
MKAAVKVMLVVIGLIIAAADAYAMSGHNRRGGGNEVNSANTTSHSGGPYASVPEPSAMYAVGSGLALLGGASWYLRRRK